MKLHERYFIAAKARNEIDKAVSDAISRHQLGLGSFGVYREGFIVEAPTGPADGDAPGAQPGRGERETAISFQHESD